jgi:putative SOS response-associated peptidase YedK
MCFYTASNKLALALAKRYGLKTDIIEMAKEIIEEQKYKINAFTHPACPIVTQSESMEVARWGLIPHWTRTAEEAQKIRKMTLNARAETVFTQPSFRSPILSKRCLFPATGYFEFHHQGKSVTPHYIFLKDEEIFSIGGMYEQWRHPQTNETIQTFSILTVPANELCAKIHNGGKNPFRMPLIISQENEKRWLQPDLTFEEITALMKTFPAEHLQAYAIKPDFIRKHPDDATIIEPYKSEIYQHCSLKQGNLPLFQQLF